MMLDTLNLGTITFTSTLIKLQSWTITPLPKHFIVEAVHPFGRTPVIAVLNAKEWNTSLWTDKVGDTMIAIPKKVRGKLEVGDEVEISFRYDYGRF